MLPSLPHCNGSHGTLAVGFNISHDILQFRKDLATVFVYNLAIPLWNLPTPFNQNFLAFFRVVESLKRIVLAK
jgi:hypothetical protein